LIQLSKENTSPTHKQLNGLLRTPADLFGFVVNAHFPFFATGKIALFPRHDTTWVEDIEYDKGDKHRK
jgi:hypothetical protein